MAPDQLGDAFVGDLQYVDEGFHGVQVAVFHSSSTSSSSSSASDTEQTHITEVPVPQTPGHTSTVPGDVRETTDAVNTTTKVDSDRSKMFERISEDRRVTTCDDEVRVMFISELAVHDFAL